MTNARKQLVTTLALIGLLMWASYQFGRLLGEARATMATMHRLEPFMKEWSVSDVQALSEAYGPSRNSENAEEWILKDFFGDERGGVFVDVGANHHQKFSNTYYLETELGWSGVAIEPQVQFAAGYKQYRPKTTFLPLFVSDSSNQQATLWVTGSDTVASGVREFTEAFGKVTATSVMTSTLDDVLNRLGIGQVDFLSMDIELAEPQALAGFSIGRFAPRLVTIEGHAPVRQQILDYFARNQYVMIGRYWHADDENFWFAPLGRSGNSAPLVAEHSH